MAAVELARERVARLLGAEDPSEVVFTSGATESNNWALRMHGPCWFSPFEHSSVRVPAANLGGSPLDCAGYRLLPPESKRELAAVMAVHNETGACLDPVPVLPWADRVLVDAAQALGKVPFQADRFDYVSCSAHKLGGPKGVGALYIRGALADEPLLQGGGQEQGRRSGTLAVASLVGFGAAAALATDEWEGRHQHALELRKTVLDRLSDLEDWRANDHLYQSAHILSLSFAGVEGESVVLELDRIGFAASAGAACSTGSTEPSPALRALDLPETMLRGTVRLSFSSQNTQKATQEMIRSLKSAVHYLRRLAKRP